MIGRSRGRHPGSRRGDKDDIAAEEVEELYDELIAAAVTLSDTFHLGN